MVKHAAYHQTAHRTCLGCSVERDRHAGDMQDWETGRLAHWEPDMFLLRTEYAVSTDDVALVLCLPDWTTDYCAAEGGGRRAKLVSAVGSAGPCRAKSYRIRPPCHRPPFPQDEGYGLVCVHATQHIAPGRSREEESFETLSHTSAIQSASVYYRGCNGFEIVLQNRVTSPLSPHSPVVDVPSRMFKRYRREARAATRAVRSSQTERERERPQPSREISCQAQCSVLVLQIPCGIR